MRRVTLGVWSAVAVVALSVVVLLELATVAPADTIVPRATADRVRAPARIAAAAIVGLLAAAVAVQGRRFVRKARPEIESIVEPATLPAATKRTVLAGGIVLIVVGGLGVIGLVGMGIVAFTFVPLAAALAVASLVGGVAAARHAQASLAGRPSNRLRLPPAWMLALALVLVVVAGEAVRRYQTAGDVDFVLFLFLGAALPPLAALALAGEEVGTPPTSRRIAVALAAGGTVSVIAAVILEIVLPSIVALLALPAGELVRELIAIVDQGAFSDLLRSPAALLLLADLTIVAPIVEEAVKPIGVIILGRRIQRPQDALLIGMACGAGFAIIENLAYEGGGLALWAGITVVRGIGGALHPFGTGLVSLGWFGVAHEHPDAWRRLGRLYLLAVGAHALWNGASGIFFLLETARRSVLGPIDLQGAVLDIALLVLFLAEGIGLLWAVRLVARSTTPVVRPAPAPSPTQALALWGVACLGVLLPVGLAAAHAILRYLGAFFTP